jgi:ubiquinone/menaquinone biosynthesis C-methylase UbiE
MKETKDKFSLQAETYKKFRPVYPDKMYDVILKSTLNRGVCWDCATGNGQVANVLSQHFNNVYATDLSEQQIKHATQRNNIIYSTGRAESSSFSDKQFDLITVAQAMHWFDFDAFGKEANRVLKDDGTICIWGYGPLQMENKVGELVNKFYKDVIGSYWDIERRHIDEGYKNVHLNFNMVEIHNEFCIEEMWAIEQLKGYFDSWSSVQNYIAKHSTDPVPDIMNEIKEAWGAEEKLKATLPIFMKIGRK